MPLEINLHSKDAAMIIAQDLKNMKQGEKLEVIGLSDKPITQEDISKVFSLIYDGNLYANRLHDNLSISYAQDGPNRLKFTVPVGASLPEYETMIDVSKPCNEYYKQQIQDKDLYEFLLTELCKVYTPIKVPLSLKLTTDKCNNIMRAISYDHPEIWFMSFSPEYTSTNISGIVNSIEIKYIEKVGRPRIASMDVQLKAKAKDIIIQVQKKDNLYDKELCLYNLLTFGKKQEQGDNSYNAYGVLVNEVAMSAGYSNTFKYLADQVGLEVITVNGNKSTWNVVKINGHYYNVMVIFGVLQNGQYSHFNIDDAHMIEFNRDVLPGFELPTCERMDEFYYNKTGNWVKGPADQVVEQMKQVCQKHLKPDTNEIKFYFDPKAGMSPNSVPSNPDIIEPIKSTIQRIRSFTGLQFKMTETVLTIGIM